MSGASDHALLDVNGRTDTKRPVLVLAGVCVLCPVCRRRIKGQGFRSFNGVLYDRESCFVKREVGEL